MCNAHFHKNTRDFQKAQLMSKTITEIVRFKTFYISKPAYKEQRLEISKFTSSWRGNLDSNLVTRS